MNAKSFSALGEMCLGPIGKYLIDITLAFSQMGFVCAMIYFINQNVHEITGISVKWISAAQFLIFSGLCFIRKIEVFAPGMIFADFIILGTIISIFMSGIVNINKEGSKLKQE